MTEIRFRSIGLNDPISITLPAHSWLGYLYAYSATDWSCTSATEILAKVQEVLLDPVFMNEQLAAAQANLDAHNAAIQQMFTGHAPELPPNMTDNSWPLGWMKNMPKPDETDEPG